MTNEIIFDGGDMAGKSTIIKFLREFGFNIKDREPEFICKYMLTSYSQEDRVEKLKINFKTKLDGRLIIFIYNDDEAIINKRIKERKLDGTLSKFDDDAVMYNKMYRDTGENILKDNTIKNFYLYNTSGKFLFDNIINMIQIFTEYGIRTDKLIYTTSEDVNFEEIKANKILFETLVSGINLDKNKALKDAVKLVMRNEEFAKIPLVYNTISYYENMVIKYKYFIDYDFVDTIKNDITDFELNQLCPCRFCSQFVNESSELNEAGNVIIKKYKNFVLGVGIGQICDRYLILTPIRHISSFSMINTEEQEELKKIMNDLIKFNQSKFNSKTAFVEHGANFINNFSKTIEHAHLHVISTTFELDDFTLPFRKIEFNEIFNISGVYNLYFDEEKTLVHESNTKISQYWRKLIASTNGREWDWRKAKETKPDLEKIKNMYHEL
ncbi:HIT family protein [Anaeromicropila populeti]|uniref:HIT domain-containing protein n=1 Tax=Anaeromicropila populeti TaxID=37658 RepID=A0A1I6INI8_9FIRM|nr:hypothetical protein [Anaeromicropila populeti]SFR68293.1 hypothetical protein SAMN05661086_00946 [Anaeromicropila populeti]